MRRGTALVVMATLLILIALMGISLSVPRPAAAMQYGTNDTAMTKSVARITFTGTYKGVTYNAKEWCSGSVAGDRWVLTALHCLHPDGNIAGTSVPWQGFRVQLWQTGMNISPGFNSILSGPPIWMSSGLSAGTLLYRDVMLLHTASPMPSWAKTIPMAFRWPAVGTALTEYGYGRTSFTGGTSSSLQKSQQGSIRRANCPSGYSWSSGSLCTSTSSSLPWSGDSGGPLVWWYNGYWQQVGTFSLYPDPTKQPGQTWRSFWSEADGSTRSWILSSVQATAPVGSILRDQASGASWVYEADGYRHWIPDGGTYICLQHAGAPVLNRALRTIEALPDMVGNWAHCEQEGSYGANSFANPHNASGMGPRLGAMAYVQVSCKVYAPEITSVNPDGYWYRIASAPWNDGYYIAANTFWNGDVPGHYPYTHNTDWNVPNC